MRTSRLLWLFTIALTCASAHDIPRSESRVQVDGREVRVALRMDLLEFPGVDTNGDGAVSYEELDAAIDRVYASIRQHYKVEASGPPVRVQLTRYGVVEGHVLDLEILYQFPQEVRELTVTSTLHRIARPGHQHLIDVAMDGGHYEEVLNAGHPQAVFRGGGTSWRETVSSFVKLGIEHIFTGYDHLAFLVGLLIVTTSLGSMVKVITSFTLAHSLTLAAATFNLVHLPVRLTESLIALSIAYVAGENLLGIGAGKRYRITFVFGLIHGFGFSNVLREMHLSRSHMALSLFSFNTGVEIGQLAFALLAFPAILWLARSRWQQQIKPAVSVAVMCLAVYWFVQRAFLA